MYSQTKKEVFPTIYYKNIIMRGYFGLGQLSSEEKSDILDKHKSVYNGYQTTTSVKHTAINCI